MYVVKSVLVSAVAAAATAWAIWAVHSNAIELASREAERASQEAERMAETSKFQGGHASEEIRKRLTESLSVHGPFLLMKDQDAFWTVSGIERPATWAVICSTLGLSVDVGSPDTSKTEITLIKDGSFLDPAECERLVLITSAWLRRIMRTPPTKAPNWSDATTSREAPGDASPIP